MCVFLLKKMTRLSLGNRRWVRSVLACISGILGMSFRYSHLRFSQLTLDVTIVLYKAAAEQVC